MRHLPKKLIPFALLTLLSSSFLYGTTTYLVTTKYGGPLQDEYEIISRNETENRTLHITSTIFNEQRTTQPSEWTDDQNNDLFPPGSRTVIVLFTLMNVSTEPVNLYDMTITANFKDSAYHAAAQTPSEDAAHTRFGFPAQYSDLYDKTTNWILKPGQYVQFAETYYTEPSNELQISLHIPESNTEERFTLLTN